MSLLLQLHTIKSGHRIANFIKTTQIICQTSQIAKSSIHTGPIGGQNSRFNNHRKGQGKKYTASSIKLLEKFVKHAAIDGAAFVYRAPYNLKIRASYFDEYNEVDAQMNRRMTEQVIRDQREDDFEELSEEDELRLEDINTFKKPPEEDSESKKDPKNIPENDQPTSEQKNVGLVNIKSSELKEQITSNTKIIEKIENKNVTSNESDIEDEEDDEPNANPLHMLLYGKRRYITSTYSTVAPHLDQEQSFLILSDYLDVSSKIFVNSKLKYAFTKKKIARRAQCGNFDFPHCEIFCQIVLQYNSLFRN